MSEVRGTPLFGVVAAALVVFLGWLSWTANRLHRAHLRREAAAASLRARLLERSDLVLQMADGLSTASATRLRGAATRARTSGGDDWIAESELSQTLRAVQLPPPHHDLLAGRLSDVTRRASVARRIHNDLTSRAIELRGRRRVRWFGLAGHAPPPSMIELDDGLS